MVGGKKHHIATGNRFYKKAFQSYYFLVCKLSLYLLILGDIGWQNAPFPNLSSQGAFIPWQRLLNYSQVMKQGDMTDNTQQDQL